MVLGGSIAGSPSAVYDPAGQALEIYARGADKTIQEYYWNGSWHGPNSLGAAQVTGSPSAVYNPLGDDLEVYATSAAGSGGATPLVEYWWRNTWHGPQTLGGSVTGSPAAVYDNEGGTLEVYAAGVPASPGAGAPLTESYWNGSSWHAGTPPSELITGRPVPVYDNEGDTFEVYATGVPPAGSTGAPLQEVWWDPAGWHGPRDLGGTLTAP
jgi:hypothetical protein